MDTTKPLMLIAEDSAIVEDYERIFADEFEMLVARDGEEAFALVDEVEKLDICVVDVIMPVETSGSTLEDTKTTGMRLIQYVLDQEKCSRFLIITVRWEIETDVEQFMPTGAEWRFLRKRDVKRASIVQDAVRELMAARPGSDDRE